MGDGSGMKGDGVAAALVNAGGTALPGMIVSSSSIPLGNGSLSLSTDGEPDEPSPSVSESCGAIGRVDACVEAVEGHIGVEGGNEGVCGSKGVWISLASRGSTSAFQGPWKGLASTRRTSSVVSKQSQEGNACSLLRRMLSVCSLSSAARAEGSVVIPVESAMRTRREVRLAMKTGRARIGLEEMLSSSR